MNLMNKETTFDRVLVIGVGNEFRSDDGVGLIVACKLKGINISGVNVLSLAGEGGDLLRVWKDYGTVFLVDAVVSGSAVGTLHRVDLRKQKVPVEFSGSSSHALGIAESVELARVLGTLPPRCIFIGIEAGNVGMGTKVSKSVAKAAEEAVKMIEREIKSGVTPLASVA